MVLDAETGYKQCDECDVFAVGICLGCCCRGCNNCGWVDCDCRPCIICVENESCSNCIEIANVLR